MTAPRYASPGPALRRLTALLVLAAAALVLGLSSPALAHDGLVATTPAGAAAVATAPAAVELEFTGEPLPLGTLVSVTGPDGAVVSAGPAQIRGTGVVQPLAADLPAGAYRVEWRSTSSDGHPLSGTFGFSVTTGSAVPAAAVATSSGGADPEAVTSASATAPDDAGIAPVWLVAGAVVVAGLGVLLVTRLRRRA